MLAICAIPVVLVVIAADHRMSVTVVGGKDAGFDPFKPRTDLEREYPKLSAMVQSVPVPDGVQAQGPLQQSIEDGPGFGSGKFPEVSQGFMTGLSCSDLEAAWTTALRAAGIKFQVDKPQATVGAPPEVILIHSRSPYLAITLGDAPTHCNTPWVEAYTDPS
jgi:hypothetical protein